MTFRLERQARRDLAKLQPTDAATVLVALEIFAERGTGDVRKLQAVDPPTWALRIGRFRVRYRREGSTFVILRIGDRRDVYR